MSSKGGEIANMADVVAMAVHRAAVGMPGADDGAAVETWNDLDEEERNQFRIIAHAAMGAHDAWLTVNGYVIAKIEKTAKGREKLVVPNRKLLGPDGRAVN